MAKYETRLAAPFDTVLQTIEQAIVRGSLSATLEDGSDCQVGGVRCAVRVFERYSMIGKNRVSLNVTLVGGDGQVFLTAITAGGSQAVFFKVNTWGEEAFLDCLLDAVKQFETP